MTASLMTYLQNREAGVETLTDRATSHNVLFTLDSGSPVGRRRRSDGPLEV